MKNKTTHQKHGLSYQSRLPFNSHLTKVIWQWVAVSSLFCAMSFPSLGHALEILTTIKPVYAITQVVAVDTDTVSLLLPAHASEHHYHLKPSDRTKIQDAEIIIWVGPELEDFLKKPFKQLKPSQSLLTLLPLSPLQLPLRTGYDWHEIPQVNLKDPHAWLYPPNAVAWAFAIADFLSEKNPEQATQYHQNAVEFERKVNSIKVPQHNGLLYVVYHDAFQYFDPFAHIQAIAPLHTHVHGVMKSQHLLYLEQLLAHQKVHCVATEPYVKDPLVTQLSERFSVPVVTLDPLGINIPADKDYYPNLIQWHLKEILGHCQAEQNP